MGHTIDETFNCLGYVVSTKTPALLVPLYKLQLIHNIKLGQLELLKTDGNSGVYGSTMDVWPCEAASFSKCEKKSRNQS